jgi:hypothetical protein
MTQHQQTTKHTATQSHSKARLSPATQAPTQTTGGTPKHAATPPPPRPSAHRRVFSSFFSVFLARLSAVGQGILPVLLPFQPRSLGTGSGIAVRAFRCAGQNKPVSKLVGS